MGRKEVCSIYYSGPPSSIYQSDNEVDECRLYFQIKVLQLVPPVAIQIAKSEMTSHYDLTHVTEVYSSGAPLPPDIYPQMRRHLARKVLFRQGIDDLFVFNHDYSRKHMQH